jgi:hypothetical protein
MLRNRLLFGRGVLHSRESLPMFVTALPVSVGPPSVVLGGPLLCVFLTPMTVAPRLESLPNVLIGLPIGYG